MVILFPKVTRFLPTFLLSHQGYPGIPVILKHPMPTYQQLLAKSSEWTSNQGLFQNLTDFELGLPAIESRLVHYLEKKPSETSAQYQRRLGLFSYTPVLLTEIRELVDRLLSAGLHDDLDTPWSPDFRINTDGKGRRILDHHDTSLTKALMFGGCFWGLLPPDRLADSLAEDTMAPRILVYSPRDVIRSGPGWFVTLENLEKPMVLGDPVKFERVTIWGPLSTDIYDIYPDSNRDNLVPSYQVNHGLGSSCLVPFRVPAKQAVGPLCISKQIQHVRFENQYNQAADTAGQTQRIYTPQVIPGDDPRVNVDTTDYSDYDFSGTDVLVGGGFAYVESEGKALDSLSQALDKVEHQIKAIVSKAFASDSPNGTVESGLSKTLDQVGLNESLKAYGLRYAESWEQTLSLLDRLMGGPGAIAVTGMSDYSCDSLDELIDKTIKLLPLSSHLSPDALVLWLQRLQASMHPGATADQIDQMQKALPVFVAPVPEVKVDVKKT
jgi:hypothetical protein